MELSDILDAKALQSMMDAFFALENIGMAIVDLRGRVLVATGWQDICTKFHRVHPEACKHCTESDVALSAGIAPGAFKLYRCQNNLWDMATPIVVGERHVGNLFLGQFFFDDEQTDREFFRAQARRYGFDERDYLAALDRVPRWSREKVDRAMTFYVRFAQQISELGYRNLQLVQALADQRRAEEELSASKRIIEGIIHAIPTRVFWKDRNLVYLGCNEAFARDAGFPSPQDVVGKDDFQMGWRDQAESYRADDRQVIESGKPKLLIEEPQTTPGGKTLALLTSKIPLRNAAGEIDGVLGTYLDVTDRKRAEAHLRFHAQLLDSVTESVVASDLEGRILYWGRGAEKLYGYAAEEVLGKPYRDFAGAIEPPDEDAFRKEILAKGSWQGEHVQKNRDGKTFWTSTVISLVMDEHGRPAGYIGIDQDITERVQAENARQESENRFRQVAETAKEWIWEMDADGVYTYSNPIVEQILGYKPEELVGKIHFHELFAPQVREEIRKDAAARAARKEAFRKRVNPVVHKDGHVVILETTGVPILDPDGHLAGYRGADTDVTQRIRAEEALQGSETRYRTFINATSDLVFLKDEAFRYLISNRANSAFFGQSEEDVTGRTDFDLMPRAAAERCRASDQEALRQGTSVVSEETAGGRVYQTVKFPVTLPGGHVGVGGFIRDVTERKQAEEALRESEAQLSNALEMAHAGHWEYDVASDTFTFNDNFYRIFRTTAEQMGGYRMASAEYARRFCHPDDMALVAQETQAAIASPDPNYSRQIEHRILYADGSVGHISVRFFIVKDAQGRTVKTYGVNQDVTAHKQAEAALRESEERYRSILNASPDNLTIADLEGRILMTSPSALTMLRCTRDDQLVGHSAFDFIVPEDRERAAADLARMFENPDPTTDEYRAIRADGSRFDVEVNGEFIRGADGLPHQLLLVIRDVTGRKQAEEKLRDSERQFKLLFESMSSGFALHEIILDEAGAPCDYRFLQVNPAFETLTGLKADALVGRTVREVLPRTESVWIERYGRVALTGEPVTFENYSGELGRHYQVTAYRPQPGQFAVLVSDVTARKQAEKALHESEQRHRDYLAHSPYGIFVADEQGRLIQVNPAACRITGYSEKELLSKSVPDLHGKDGREEAARHFQAVLRDGKASGELTFRTKSGEPRWWLVSAVKISDVRFLGFCNDITDRKQAEEKLQASAERFRDIAANIPGTIYQLQTGRTGALEVSYMSSGCEALFGRPLAGLDFTGLLFDHMHVGDRALFQHSLAKAAEQMDRWSLEFRVATAEGTNKWLRGSANPRQTPQGGILWNGVLLDITELKRTEESLREREAFQALLMDTIPSPVFYKDRQGRYLGFNKAFETLYGKTKEQLIGKSVFDIAPPELAKIYHAKDIELLERPGTQVYEAPMRDANGGLHSVVFHKASIIDARGAVAGLIGILLDVTERKRTEEKILQESLLNKTIIDSIPGTFYMLDEAGNYMRWSKYQQEQIVGQPDELMRQTNALATIHPDDRALVQARIENVLKNGVDEVVEGRVLLRGGPDFRWLLMTGRRMVVDGRPALIGIGIDITERKEAEKQVAQQLDELRRWQTVTLGREGRVAELKREVNALATRLGQPPPYPSAEAP